MNRKDLLFRGLDKKLYHKIWDGEWREQTAVGEERGLYSAPALVSNNEKMYTIYSLYCGLPKLKFYKEGKWV